VQSEFDIAVPLTASARRHLRQFVEEFIDTSFNPLFIHLRKSIEREVDRVVDVNRMQFFYLISWFLEAECARRAQAKESRTENGKQNEGAEAQPEDESFAIIAGVMDQETFVLLNRHMQRTQDTSAWNDLNAVMKCFTQIVSLVWRLNERC
jgi:replication fork protection complex subunit Tof1/Swi1